MHPSRCARPGSILVVGLLTAVPLARAQVQPPPVNFSGHGPGTPVSGSSSTEGVSTPLSPRKADSRLAWYSRFVNGLPGTWCEGGDNQNGSILEIERTPTLFRLQARHAGGGPAETGFFSVSSPAQDRLSLSWGPTRRLYYGEKTCSVAFEHGDDVLVGDVVASTCAFPGVAAGSRWRIAFAGGEIVLTDLDSGTMRRFLRIEKRD